MKRLITDVYNAVYKITKAKTLSFILALICVTLLNFIVIYGLTILLDEWLPTRAIQKIFTHPYYFFTFFLLLLINFIIMATPEKFGKRLRSNSSNIPAILIYSVIAVILFAYIYYAKKN